MLCKLLEAVAYKDSLLFGACQLYTYPPAAPADVLLHIQDVEYDSMNNPINFINKYIVLPTNLTNTDTLSIQLDEDQLDEGYYKLSAKVALVSQFPDLIDLEGENPILQVRHMQDYSAFQAGTIAAVQKPICTAIGYTTDT